LRRIFLHDFGKNNEPPRGKPRGIWNVGQFLDRRLVGVPTMNIATVLKVFKNSSIVTPQGEFKISRVFDNARAAEGPKHIQTCYATWGRTLFSLKLFFIKIILF
jgi:hypothetical protein